MARRSRREGHRVKRPAVKPGNSRLILFPFLPLLQMYANTARTSPPLWTTYRSSTSLPTSASPLHSGHVGRHCNCQGQLQLSEMTENWASSRRVFVIDTSVTEHASLVFPVKPLIELKLELALSVRDVTRYRLRSKQVCLANWSHVWSRGLSFGNEPSKAIRPTSKDAHI